MQDPQPIAQALPHLVVVCGDGHMERMQMSHRGLSELKLQIKWRHVLDCPPQADQLEWARQ